MKKCLCCDNNIEKMNHYVCNECYKKIKELKKEFVLINNKELYKEYYRWLRNKNFTKNTKYKNEYQMKIIAIAEVIKDKYNDDQKIKDIIDHSNSQEINIETIKLNEAKEEENFNNELAKANEVDLEKIITYKKCDDGHRVISLGEMSIDNWLTQKRIRHYYDMEIDDNTSWRYDFYLPDYDIFIEFWGLDNEKYLARRKAKEEYYAHNQYKLIGIEPKDINNLNTFLLRALKEKNPNIFKK